MKYFSWRDTVQNVDVAILLNPLHPKINMHNLHTVHYTFNRMMKENLCTNQHLLQLVIIYFILVTFIFESGLILQVKQCTYTSSYLGQLSKEKPQEKQGGYQSFFKFSSPFFLQPCRAFWRKSPLQWLSPLKNPPKNTNQRCTSIAQVMGSNPVWA